MESLLEPDTFFFDESQPNKTTVIGNHSRGLDWQLIYLSKGMVQAAALVVDQANFSGSQETTTQSTTSYFPFSMDS